MAVKTSVRTGAALLIALAFAASSAAAAADDDRRGGKRLKFSAIATAAQEVPNPPDTDAIGKVTVEFDRGLTRAHVRLRLHGIDSMVLAAHLHCARAGMNGPPAFGLLNPGPLTEIGERTRVTLTNADAVNDCTGVVGRPVNNVAALFFAMRDGLIYFNVHTADHPPGELRGQLLED